MIASIQVRPTTETQFTGEQFQDLIMPRIAQMKRDREAAIDRPGVHATVIQRYEDGTSLARIIPSLPDFQGVYGRPQRETIFDVKVCGTASFPLNKYRIEERKARSRQLKHMYERASFGSVCFFLIHWNARELKKKTEPAVTYAFPIQPDHPFWVASDVGSEKSIKRSHCEAIAKSTAWKCHG
jgi:penicillin-binding protein-related factor A (putative recombinase)